MYIRELFLKDKLILKIIIGLTIGIIFGRIFSTLTINSELAAIILIAAIDSVIEGLKLKLNEQFKDKEIFSRFILNFCAATILLYLGKYLSMNLHYLALFAIGLNIFKNLSAIRQRLIKNL